MRDFDKEIMEHQKEIDRIKAERESHYKDELAVIKDKISSLNSTDLLELIQEETTKRRVKRGEICGGNDIEINKINMLLKDEFWCVKIYIMTENGEYMGMTQDSEEAYKFMREARNTGTDIKEEIVDLRNIY
jgi:hypothetical protein